MTTGMRAGEVLALKLSDIGERQINVQHSWSPVDGLKCPKNGEIRTVPLLPEVKQALLNLAKESPWGQDGFIFYSTLRDKPMDSGQLLAGLHEVLASIGIDAKARNIVFHSWRHYYAARMTDRLTAEQVAKATGHKSRAVFEEYANHASQENLDEMAEASREVFSNVLRFVKPEGATA
jgi:integrase